jgi:hypothetical protein
MVWLSDSSILVGALRGSVFLGTRALAEDLWENGSDIPASLCFQSSKVFHLSMLAVLSSDQTFSNVVPPLEDPYPSTRAHYTPHA